MLIGINGFKGAGKNVVGDYLVEQYDFKHVSFAALLKQSAGALFDIDPKRWDYLKNDAHAIITLEDPINFSMIKMTVREFLQRYGTESHRDVFGYDFWVEQAFNNMEIGSLPHHHDTVFTDARFENELQAIRENGGFNIQILRDATDGESGGHASEVRPNPDLIDAVIENNGGFEELYNTVDEVMGGFGV